MTYSTFESSQHFQHSIYPTKVSTYEPNDFALAPAPVLRGGDVYIPETPTNESREFSWDSPSSISSFDDTPTKDVTCLTPKQSQAITSSLTSPVEGTPGQLPDKITKMKLRRKRRTIAAGVTGGVIGLVALGPVGAVAGGVGSAVATKVIGKRMERRKMEKIAANNLGQELANAPSIKVHDATFS
uniref:Uncharacterized protein n=1 Tax=Entomoneis paludosa TaxID=265537 RepID=A0A7S2V6T6_9STRA|eukprot:CAMPEP_0172440616 /NCGR_PEP_ID=MMETSP1065-20121228/1269_1 /TAXON_ID=265537 /ORGANISM="Amphiprora paludosa, Strain CCMP125" /LENGTH=184 /DNA_ID=CAMNT_0013189567 /DNA_START=11 /DNA_END=565 /DNA_ORIENTATION=+